MSPCGQVVYVRCFRGLVYRPDLVGDTSIVGIIDDIETDSSFLQPHDPISDLDGQVHLMKAAEDGNVVFRRCSFEGL